MRRADASWLAAIVVLSLFAIPPRAGAERIVAVGDIHGSLDGLTAILEKVGLIDADHRWSGGSSVFVQTGDYLDRGEHVLQVMDLLMDLQEQADRAGGEVIVLLGNHETMNLLRVTRDVNPNVYASLVTPDSEERRDEGLHDYMESLDERIVDREDLPPVSDADRVTWLASHPPGYLEYLEELGPDGQYGKWLRQRPVTARVGKIGFMHAGANPEIAEWTSSKELNSLVADEIRAFDSALRFMIRKKFASDGSDLTDVMAGSGAALEQFLALAANRSGRELERRWPRDQVHRLRRLQDIDQWTAISPEKALWFRGLAAWQDSEQVSAEALLDRLGAECLVAGHTTLSPGDIRVRFDQRVFLIDTGMLTSAYAGGRASALVFEESRIVAHYLDETVVLSEDRGRCR